MVKAERLSPENAFKVELCLRYPEKIPHLPDSGFPFCVLERFPSQKRKWALVTFAPHQREVGAAAIQSLSSRLDLRTRDSRQPSKHPPERMARDMWQRLARGGVEHQRGGLFALTQKLVKRLFFISLVQFWWPRVGPS